MDEVLGKILSAVLTEVVLVSFLSAGGTSAFRHEIRRRVGKDFDQSVLSRCLDGALHNVDLIQIGGVIVNVCLRGVIPDKPARDSGICTGDVTVRRGVAAADVIAHDVQAQTVRPEDGVDCKLGERIRVSQPVCPPAQAGSPALKYAAVGRDGFVGGYFDCLINAFAERSRCRHAQSESENGKESEKAVCHGMFRLSLWWL